MRITEIERRFTDLYRQERESDATRLTELKLMVAQGLELDGGIPDIAREYLNMIETIAVTVSDCTQILGIPLPNEFGLTYPWGGKAGKYKSVLAKADLDESYPRGKISFSPHYLLSFAKILQADGFYYDFKRAPSGRVVIRTGPVESLTYVTAHETYHLWQGRKYPDVFAKHVAIEQSNNLSSLEWSSLRLDRAAQMFGDLYFTERLKLLEPELVDEYISATTS